MKCKSCKNEIPDGSIFCNWCGERQVRERKKKDEIKVPKPTQLPSGKWNIYLRAEGQSVTEDTAEACELKAKAIRAGFVEVKKTQNKFCPDMTLREVIDAYIEKYRKVLSPSTIRGYQTYKNNRFKKYMDLKVKDISDWQALINDEIGIVCSKTITNGWSCLHVALADLKFYTPEVKLPTVVSKEHEWLDASDELALFLELIKGNKYEIPILMGLLSLRRSEIMAVTWDKVDLKKNTIKVHGALIPNDKNQFVYKEANKETASRREVKIMIPRLIELLAAVPDNERNGYVVKCAPNTIYREVNKICKSNNLPLIGTHGLRHTFASAALETGVDESEVKDIGGWADPGTMHKIYEHIGKARRLKAKNNLEKFFMEISEEK